MQTEFNFGLVFLSLLVAVFASYVALNLSQNIVQAKGQHRVWWLVFGALAMGTGIWSMHFVGMLAFEMPGMSMAYDIPLMVLSIVVAIGASLLAFFIVSQPVVLMRSLMAGGVAMAVAMAGMHYIGMYSMRMGASIIWDLFLVTLSIVIALISSFGALFVFLRIRHHPERIREIIIASILLGIGISGMHYTGMLAATFIHHNEAHQIQHDHLLVSGELTIAVVVSTLLTLGLALVGSIGQKLWNQRRKQEEILLDRTEERFLRLVAAVKDYAIFMLDPNGYITTWNIGAERINGYTAEEAVGKHVSLFYQQEDIDKNTADFELSEALEKGSYRGEGIRVRKDGSTYWSNVVIAPVFDEQGQLECFSKITRDITAHRVAHQRQRELNEELEARVQERTLELQNREKQLRTITNASPILLAQFDKNEKFLFSNEAFCKWIGRNYDEILGRTFREVTNEGRYKDNKPFVDKVLAGEAVNYERHSVSSTNAKATLNVTFVPEFDSDNNTCGFILVATDITKYKEIQTELERAKQDAESANATKSAFLANMSHEIRTPLGAVLGFSELLLSHNMSSSDRTNAVEVIKRNGRLLSNVINDILDLSKVEAGKLEFEKLDVPITEVMKEISTVLNLEAINKGIELTVSTDGPVPSHIHTDPLRLRQILVNLVGNAIKFTDRGSVNVMVKLAQKEEKLKLAFEIKDTGSGIDPQQASRLFQPFTQADVSTTRKYGGTGLGLVLSRRLAHALGGDVELAQTEVGKGSTFVLTINPGSPGQLLFKSSFQDSSSNVTPIRQELPILLKDIRVLLVEDSQDNQHLIKRILGFAGAYVEVANNGREGVSKAKSSNYDLILMDLQMPEMDGYEATRLLRQDGYKKPIIALTAHAMKEERERSLNTGFNDHITKPIDSKLLIKAISLYSSLDPSGTTPIQS